MMKESIIPKPDSLVNFQIYTHERRNFMIMPFYAATLEHIPNLSIQSGRRLYSQISEALRFIHTLGFNHMDVKPSNICVRENGDFVLIDIGSIVKLDEYSESTVCYVPADYQSRVGRFQSSNRYKADARGSVDWMMLAMTIAEKVFGLEVGGGSKTPPTMTGLYEILSPDKSESLFDELLTILKSYFAETVDR